MLRHVQRQTVPDILKERASEISAPIHKFRECNVFEDTHIHPHSYHNIKSSISSYS